MGSCLLALIPKKNCAGADGLLAFWLLCCINLKSNGLIYLGYGVFYTWAWAPRPSHLLPPLRAGTGPGNSLPVRNQVLSAPPTDSSTPRPSRMDRQRWSGGSASSATAADACAAARRSSSWPRLLLCLGEGGRRSRSSRPGGAGPGRP